MDWKIIGTIGIVFTFLLSLANAVVRSREQQMEVHPGLKNPLAWLQLLMLPAGAITATAGILLVGIKDGTFLNLGLALAFTGLAGWMAMDVGDNFRRKNTQPGRLQIFLGLLIFLLMACMFWIRLSAG
jgi:hypothetical protein